MIADRDGTNEREYDRDPIGIRLNIIAYPYVIQIGVLLLMLL